MRPTKTIKLPSGLEVNVYTYVTAKDSLEMRAVMSRAMKMDIEDINSDNIGEGKKVPMKGQIDGSILIEQEKVMVKALVASVVGFPIGETAEAVANMQVSDYEVLVKDLESIKNGNLVPSK